MKKQTKDGFFDITFWHTVTINGDDVENVLHGSIIIATPVGGILHIVPVAKTIDKKYTFVSDAIKVWPESVEIYPNHISNNGVIEPNGVIEDCLIPITISCYHPDDENHRDGALEGNCIDLHFYVTTTDGREIDLGSESIDYYRFILSQDWDKEQTEGNNEGDNND